ncbi:molybdenum cofactor guanylyltransferase [Halobacillus andaensis]|uniref:molybdenum cofactor guanylyltransferase n=1 Tax=Halobacillus andaensis TaxID=1176239 RepID=UPI003D70E9D9
MSGAILAGGGSTRMGRDKSELVIGEVTVLERIGAILKRNFSQIIINRNNPASVQAVYVKDQYEQHGPLGGLHAVLSETPTQYVFVSACDTPFLKTEIIEFLLSRLTSDIDAVIPVYNGRSQPLSGIYRKELAQRCALLLEKGERKMQSLLNVSTVIYVENFPAIDPEELYWHFFNMNTGKDYEAALKKIQAE